MKLYYSIYIYIAYSITVSHKKCFVPYIFLYTSDASSCHCIITSIYNCHFPILKIGMMYCHFVLSITEVKCNIRIIKEVISKPFFDIFLFITCADYKFFVTIIGIFFHNMPKNRHSTNLNHRLWLKYALFRNTRAKTTCQEYYFHLVLYFDI